MLDEVIEVHFVVSSSMSLLFVLLTGQIFELDNMSMVESKTFCLLLQNSLETSVLLLIPSLLTCLVIDKLG